MADHERRRRGRMRSCRKLLLIPALLGFLAVYLGGASSSSSFLNNTDIQTAGCIGGRCPSVRRFDELFKDDDMDTASHEKRKADLIDRVQRWALRNLFSVVFRSSSSENSEQEKLKEMQEDIKLMDSTIQSSSENFDQEKLKEMPQVVKLMSEDELADCKKKLKELMNQIAMPSRAKMMQRVIADVKNISSSFEDSSWALNKLLIFLEDIDDAYNFEKFGGLSAVIQALNSNRAEVRVIAAWLLGKACQINPNIQYQILELDALPNLMKMVNSTIGDEAVRALHAVSHIVRDNLDGLEKFYSEYGGAVMIQEIMSNSSADIRLRRKSALLADLAEYHLENLDEQRFSPFSSLPFLKSLVHLIRSSDFYLQRKALMAFKKIIPLFTTTEAAYLKKCDLDAALGRMGKELNDLVEEREELGDILLELESLHKEVGFLYRSITSRDKKGTAPRRTALAIVKSCQFIWPPLGAHCYHR